MDEKTRYSLPDGVEAGDVIARGCRIEHDAAVAYGLDVLYEDWRRDT